MATLAPMSTTPARRPFGLLSDSKIRSLQSMKNRQNDLTTNSAPSLKRRHASPETSDTENVDPNLLDSLKKRKRASVEDDVPLSKTFRYSPTTVTSTKPRLSTHMVTPRLDTIAKVSSTPASAPAAAGRSPTKAKTQGILGSRRRFAPPSFGTKSPSLSIAAALCGTIANKKVRKVRTIEELKPKSWFFDIFEESEEQQDYAINEWNMTQSATILDISDDESKAKTSNDRGKENIDPNEASVTVTRSMTSKAAVPRVTRKDMMTDEPRTPLGDLNASEYYPEGLDATSVVLVHDEPAQPEGKDTVVETATSVDPIDLAHDCTSKAPLMTTSLPSESKMTTAEVGALLIAAATVWDTETLIDSTAGKSSELEADNRLADIEIWESGSAKDENESEETEPKMEGRGFALQEI